MFYSTRTVFNDLERFFTYLAPSGMKKPATAKGVFLSIFYAKKKRNSERNWTQSQRNWTQSERNLNGLDFGEQFRMGNNVNITIFNDSEHSWTVQ